MYRLGQGHVMAVCESQPQIRQHALVLYDLKELGVQPPKKLKVMDDLLTHRLIATLPDCEPTEWNSNKRMSRFSLNSRKPRPVLIEFPSIDSKQKILKISKQLQQTCLRLDDWLTELQGALLTLTSKLRKGLQAFLWRLKTVVSLQ